MEINWTTYIEDDFLEYGFTNEEIIKVKEKVEIASKFLHKLEKVTGFSKKYDIRKVRYRNFRIFLLLNWIVEKIDCLRMFPDHRGYDKKRKNQILTIASKVS